MNASADHSPTTPALSPEEAVAAFDAALTTRSGRVLVLPAGSRIEDLRDAPDDLPATTSASDALQRQVVHLYAEALGRPGIDPHADFFELGGESLTAVHLVSEIARELWPNIRMEDFLEASTAAKMAARIASRRATPTEVSLSRRPEPAAPERPRSRAPTPTSDALVVPLHTGGDETPLFCLPGAGGAGFAFHALARHLGQNRPIYAFQARGLDAGEHPDLHVEDMAITYLERMRALAPDGPHGLLGYSFGGIVALEIAQRLTADGHPASFLGLIDTPLQRGTTRPMTDDADLLHYLSNDAPELHPSLLRPLSPDEQYRRFFEVMHPRGVMPSDFSPAQVRRFVEVLRANSRAALMYVARPYEAAPLHYFAASEHDRLSPEPLHLPWIPLAPRGLVIHSIPGRHLVLLDEPHVRGLASSVRDALKETS